MELFYISIIIIAVTSCFDPQILIVVNQTRVLFSIKADTLFKSSDDYNNNVVTLLLSSRTFEWCSGSNEDGAFLDGTSINTAFLDGTLLDTDDDDRADGVCSTMRSVSFQSFDGGTIDEGGNGDDNTGINPFGNNNGVDQCRIYYTRCIIPIVT